MGSVTQNYITKAESTTTITNLVNSQIFDNGTNVGVGTASPGATVHLYKSDGNVPNTHLRIQQGSRQYWDIYTDANEGLIFRPQKSTVNEFPAFAIQDKDSNSKFWIDTNTSVGYFSGSVGIGVTNPALQFTVQGASSGTGVQDAMMALRTTTAANRCAIQFVNSGNTTSFNDLGYIGAIIESGNAKGALYFVTRNSDGDNTGVAERMRITAAGNVGIGTTSPSDKLEVRGVDNGITISSAVTDRPQLNLVNGSTSILRLSGNGTYGAIGDGTDSDRYMIFRSGNIGIGTTNPNTKLQIVGISAIMAATNTTTGGSSYIRFENTTDNTTSYFGLDGSGLVNTSVGSTLIGSSANKDIILAPALTERVRFTSTGNVGIGTTSISYKLQVNGTMYSAGSSQEYKHHITPYDAVTDKILKLQPVTYQYKPEYEHLGKKLHSDTQIGLIAEQVMEIFPELAVMKEEEGQWVVRNVDYEKLAVILLSEVQKLRKEVNYLKTL